MMDVMGMEPSGMRGRWARMRDQRDDQFEHDVEAMVDAYKASHPADPIDQLATAVSAALRQPGKQRDTHLSKVMQAAASGQESLRAIVARREERAQRNGAVARRAYAQYQATRQAWIAEQDQAGVDGGPSLLVAAAMHLDPGPLRIY